MMFVGLDLQEAATMFSSKADEDVGRKMFTNLALIRAYQGSFMSIENVSEGIKV